MYTIVGWIVSLVYLSDFSTPIFVRYVHFQHLLLYFVSVPKRIKAYVMLYQLKWVFLTFSPNLKKQCCKCNVVEITIIMYELGINLNLPHPHTHFFCEHLNGSLLLRPPSIFIYHFLVDRVPAIAKLDESLCPATITCFAPAICWGACITYCAYTFASSEI